MRRYELRPGKGYIAAVKHPDLRNGKTVLMFDDLTLIDEEESARILSDELPFDDKWSLSYEDD